MSLKKKKKTVNIYKKYLAFSFQILFSFILVSINWTKYLIEFSVMQFWS